MITSTHREASLIDRKVQHLSSKHSLQLTNRKFIQECAVV
jgi:hypothetical protein